MGFWFDGGPEGRPVLRAVRQRARRLAEQRGGEQLRGAASAVRVERSPGEVRARRAGRPVRRGRGVQHGMDRRLWFTHELLHRRLVGRGLQGPVRVHMRYRRVRGKRVEEALRQCPEPRHLPGAGVPGAVLPRVEGAGGVGGGLLADPQARDGGPPLYLFAEEVFSFTSVHHEPGAVWAGQRDATTCVGVTANYHAGALGPVPWRSHPAWGQVHRDIDIFYRRVCRDDQTEPAAE
mmetsp:Transcript_109210/g.284729  ORF Transcript_109210/g.284729 Transcript_109210/m.284729 type:complete len:235 (+) Transcript_109210:576-1280(+)